VLAKSRAAAVEEAWGKQNLLTPTLLVEQEGMPCIAEFQFPLSSTPVVRSAVVVAVAAVVGMCTCLRMLMNT
jgi:hypothetical protein